MEALFVSTGVVALAEIGDKTQLLAFILAARFKKPWPIIAGILCTTIVNHGVAGALGAWITSAVSPGILRWVLGASFIGMAIWTLTLTVEAGHDIAVEARRRVMQRHRVLNLMTHVDPWRRPDGDHEKVSAAAA